MLEFSPYYIKDEIQKMSPSLLSALSLEDIPEEENDSDEADILDLEDEFEEDDTLGEDDPNDWDDQTDFDIRALQQDYIHSIRL